MIHPIVLVQRIEEIMSPKQLFFYAAHALSNQYEAVFMYLHGVVVGLGGVVNAGVIVHQAPIRVHVLAVDNNVIC